MITWKTTYRDQRGYVCELAIEAEDSKAALETAGKALAYLEGQGCKPFDPYEEPKAAAVAARVAANLAGQPSPPAARETPESWCPIHDVQMSKHEGADGSSWYSHKTPEGWCRGKAKGK